MSYPCSSCDPWLLLISYGRVGQVQDIAPAVVFLAAFFLLPLAQTIALSFEPGSGFGIENYTRMIGDLNFTTAIRNTFLLVITVVRSGET